MPFFPLSKNIHFNHKGTANVIFVSILRNRKLGRLVNLFGIRPCVYEEQIECLLLRLGQGALNFIFYFSFIYCQRREFRICVFLLSFLLAHLSEKWKRQHASVGCFFMKIIREEARDKQNKKKNNINSRRFDQTAHCSMFKIIRGKNVCLRTTVHTHSARRATHTQRAQLLPAWKCVHHACSHPYCQLKPNYTLYSWRFCATPSANETL